MRRKVIKIQIVVALMILGIAMGMQVRSVAEQEQKKVSVQRNISELMKQINMEKAEIKEISKRIKQLEDKKNSELQYFVDIKNSSMLDKKKEMLDRVELIAGLKDVKGKGIIVTLDDTQQIDDSMMQLNPNLFIIHDKDVFRVVNELRKAGAQAIAINDERVVASSAQKCEGTTIMVNTERFSVPYKIKALGDPEVLFAALDTSAVISELREFKLQVEITKNDNMLINRYIDKNPNNKR